MENIYDISSRTRCKIIRRINPPCSNCGWNEDVCDIHHIIPICQGGTNDHTNLTILCPNCHRLAHKNKISKFMPLSSQIGDKWKEYYAQTNILSIEKAKEGNLTSLSNRKKKAQEKAEKIIESIKKSNIDFSQYGWVEKVSNQFGIRYQHIPRLLKKYDIEFYNSCYRRIGKRK